MKLISTACRYYGDRNQTLIKNFKLKYSNCNPVTPNKGLRFILVLVGEACNQLCATIILELWRFFNFSKGTKTQISHVDPNIDNVKHISWSTTLLAGKITIFRLVRSKATCIYVKKLKPLKTQNRNFWVILKKKYRIILTPDSAPTYPFFCKIFCSDKPLWHVARPICHKNFRLVRPVVQKLWSKNQNFYRIWLGQQYIRYALMCYLMIQSR